MTLLCLLCILGHFPSPNPSLTWMRAGHPRTAPHGAAADPSHLRASSKQEGQKGSVARVQHPRHGAGAGSVHQHSILRLGGLGAPATAWGRPQQSPLARASLPSGVWGFPPQQTLHCLPTEPHRLVASRGDWSPQPRRAEPTGCQPGRPSHAQSSAMLPPTHPLHPRQPSGQGMVRQSSRWPDPPRSPQGPHGHPAPPLLP